MQTRHNGKLTIYNGRRSLWDGLRLFSGAVVDIKSAGAIFTYETTSGGELDGNGKIFVHILFKHVQGTKNPILNIIYYGTRPFSIREIQIMQGSIILVQEPTRKDEFDVTD